MLFALGELDEHRIRAGSLGLLTQPVTEPLEDRIADDEHIFAVLNGQAVVDNGVDSPVQIAHRAAA